MLRPDAHPKDRIEFARSLVSFLASTVGQQDPVSLEGHAAFGLYTLLVEIEDQLTAVIGDGERMAEDPPTTPANFGPMEDEHVL